MRFKRPQVRYADTPQPATPYQSAAQVWDERIGSARVQAKNWRLMAFGSLLLALLMAGGLVWRSAQSIVMPYVVEVDNTGQVRAIGEAATPYRPTDAQTAHHIARFVTLVRSLSIDPIVVRQNWLDAYDYTTDKGAAVLNDYARVNDPFARIGKESVTVQITSVVRASDTSFNVRWTQRRFVNGAAAGLERWTAVVSIVHQTPRTEERLRKNPLASTSTACRGGDTVRWIVGDTSSGSAADLRVNVLVKPIRSDLKTNLVITTSHRTYLLELTSTQKAWMASVSWDYPRDRMLALQRQAQTANTATPIDTGLSLENLRFRYAISGSNPPWKPLRAFDDGEKVYIQFPAGIAQGELPPLFVIGAQGDGQLVNYRFRSPYYIVDRLFGAAELRLGADKGDVVRIERTDGTRRNRP